jgi:hypothetical protein
LTQESRTRNLLLSALPHHARKAHILPGLVHHSLISGGQLCDSGFDITFTRERVEVTEEGQCVMAGLRDPQSRLWRVNLKESMKPERKADCKHAHDYSNQKELINYLHAVCFSPVKSTWIQAIKIVNFTSWPGLTEQATYKHSSKSTSTVKGHTNQQRIHARSMKIKKEEYCKNKAQPWTADKKHIVYIQQHLKPGKYTKTKPDSFQRYQSGATHTLWSCTNMMIMKS